MSVRIICVAVLAVTLIGCDGRPLGKHVFQSRCSACHTLTGHDTSIDGGDLAIGRMSVAGVESFARIMPVRPRLTSAELHAVAAYVVDRRETLQTRARGHSVR